jgi:protein-tyrosine phosphatase
MEPKELDEILTGHLFLGSAKAARNKKLLKDLKIKYIVNAAFEIKNYHPEDFVYPPQGFSFRDTLEEDITPKLETAWELFEKARDEGVGVLCHCAAGVSRSSSLVISYLMKHKNMTLKVIEIMGSDNF